MGGERVSMRLQLLLSHAGSVHGVLFSSAGSAAPDGGATLAGRQEVPVRQNGLEVKGLWDALGRLDVVVVGDGAEVGVSCGDGVLGRGTVFQGVAAHVEGEGRVRGSFGRARTVSGDVDVVQAFQAASAELERAGQFEWRLQKRRQPLPHVDRPDSTTMQTSLMTFLESHYKQRCELKLRGARVVRRSLLQRMSMPRTFECIFQAFEADGSDRKATVTIGSAAQPAPEPAHGFFLYQQGRLMSGGVDISLPEGCGGGRDGSGGSKMYLGVVDMGLSPAAMREATLQQGDAGAPNCVVGGTVELEWMKDFHKWRQVQKELERVLAKYAGVAPLEGATGAQQAVAGSAQAAGNAAAARFDSTGGMLQQQQRGDMEKLGAVTDRAGANGHGGVRRDEAWGGEERVELAAVRESLMPGKGVGNWIYNGKGKIVDRSRCRIAGRVKDKDGNTWRCPNPPMPGGGGLCSFHCKKKPQSDSRPSEAAASSGGESSPRPKDGLVRTLASTRQPRRIIKNSRLADSEDSDRDNDDLRAWGRGARSGRKPEDKASWWKVGERAWVRDVAHLLCPIAGLSLEATGDVHKGGDDVAMEVKHEERNGRGSDEDEQAEPLREGEQAPRSPQQQQQPETQESIPSSEGGQALCGKLPDEGEAAAGETCTTKASDGKISEGAVEHASKHAQGEGIPGLGSTGEHCTAETSSVSSAVPDGGGANGDVAWSGAVDVDAASVEHAADEATASKTEEDLDEDLDDGGLPSLHSIDLSLLHREVGPGQKKSETAGPAHKNVAVTKVLLNAEIAAEIYKTMPTNRSEHKLRSTEISGRYGVAPKTIRDVWDHKTWSKATQHLWAQHMAEHPVSHRKSAAALQMPPPASKILLGTVVSGKLGSGKYLVKLDEDAHEVECYPENLHRLHPVTLEPADPEWAEAEEARRVEAEEAAALKAAATGAGSAGIRKRGRNAKGQNLHHHHQGAMAEGNGASQGGGVAGMAGAVAAGGRHQRNSLEGRCRTVIARLLRSETATSLGEMQEMMYREEERAAAEGDATMQGAHWLVLDELHRISERAERKGFATFFDFWEGVLGVWRTLAGRCGADSPLHEAAQQLVAEFDRIFEDTFADDLARLRSAPGGADADAVEGMDFFGLRVCVYNAKDHRLQYGMVDDADDGSVHVMYDDEEEGWVCLPSKQLMVLRPHEEDPGDDEANAAGMAADGNATGTGGGVQSGLAPELARQSVGDDEFAALDHGGGQGRAPIAGSVMSPLKMPSRVIESEMLGEGNAILKAHVKLPVHVFQLGIQVEVLYDDGTWYLGRITQYSEEFNEHRIVFDDGDWQEITLPDPDVRLASLTSHGEAPADLKESSGEAPADAKEVAPPGAAAADAEKAYCMGDLIW